MDPQHCISEHGGVSEASVPVVPGTHVLAWDITSWYTTRLSEDDERYVGVMGGGTLTRRNHLGSRVLPFRPRSPPPHPETWVRLAASFTSGTGIPAGMISSGDLVSTMAMMTICSEKKVAPRT